MNELNNFEEEEVKILDKQNSEEIDENELTKKQRILLKKERREIQRIEENEQAKKKRKIKWIIAFGAIAIVFFIMLSGEDKPKPPADGEIGDYIVALEVLDDDWIKGNPKASHTLVEYSDFECSACRAYYNSVNRLVVDLGDDIRVVFRHFPLDSVHKNARIAGQAAEAAGMQGKFWEMHDELYMKQPIWTKSENPKNEFISYAKEMGLDVPKFEDDIESRLAERAIDKDYDLGIRSFVDSTPTFYFDGEPLSVSPDYESFRAFIQSKIKPKTQK